MALDYRTLYRPVWQMSYSHFGRGCLLNAGSAWLPAQLDNLNLVCSDLSRTVASPGAVSALIVRNSVGNSLSKPGSVGALAAVIGRLAEHLSRSGAKRLQSIACSGYKTGPSRPDLSFSRIAVPWLGPLLLLRVWGRPSFQPSTSCKTSSTRQGFTSASLERVVSRLCSSNIP